MLVVRTHYPLVTFVCRIGHVYSRGEPLAAKEEILERLLWIANSAMDELAVLLEEFARPGLEDSDSAPHRHRGAIARDEAAKLRSIIEADRPLMSKGVEECSA